MINDTRPGNGIAAQTGLNRVRVSIRGAAIIQPAPNIRFARLPVVHLIFVPDRVKLWQGSSFDTDSCVAAGLVGRLINPLPLSLLRFLPLFPYTLPLPVLLESGSRGRCTYDFRACGVHVSSERATDRASLNLSSDSLVFFFTGLLPFRFFFCGVQARFGFSRFGHA